MPSFRVETPQRAYDAIVERGAISRLTDVLPAKAGTAFVVTTADVWQPHGRKVKGLGRPGCGDKGVGATYFADMTKEEIAAVFRRAQSWPLHACRSFEFLAL